MPRIISWNTQGDSISKLSEVYGKLLSSGNDNIIMIQEAGNVVAMYGSTFQKSYGSSTRGGHSFDATFYAQTNAKNQRCTTGMLVENGFTVNAFNPFVTTTGRRPVVACECSYEDQDFVFATVHSTANEHPAKKELLEINRMFKNKYDDVCPWLVMGDFNCDAEKLDFDDINISFPDSQTQENGNTLDFAIFSDSMLDALGEVNVEIYSDPEGYVPLESDHFPVYCEF